MGHLRISFLFSMAWRLPAKITTLQSLTFTPNQVPFMPLAVFSTLPILVVGIKSFLLCSGKQGLGAGTSQGEDGENMTLMPLRSELCL